MSPYHSFHMSSQDYNDQQVFPTHKSKANNAKGGIRCRMCRQNLYLFDNVVNLVLDFTHVFIVQTLHHTHRSSQTRIYVIGTSDTHLPSIPWWEDHQESTEAFFLVSAAAWVRLRSRRSFRKYRSDPQYSHSARWRSAGDRREGPLSLQRPPTTNLYLSEWRYTFHLHRSHQMFPTVVFVLNVNSMRGNPKETL